MYQENFTFMNNRLQQFLELENITPARLADTLGVQRSGLSHILSGRNKPGFEFITKLLTKFPHINSEWLIMGKGKPYKEMNTQNSTTSPLSSQGTKNFSGGKNQDSLPGGNNHNMYDSILYNGIQSNGLPYNNVSYNAMQYDDLQIEGLLHTDIQYNGVSYENSPLPGNETGIFPEGNTGQSSASVPQQSDNLQNKPQNNAAQPSENRVNGVHKTPAGQKKRIKRVIVFYSDGSFEELFPHIG